MADLEPTPAKRTRAKPAGSAQPGSPSALEALATSLLEHALDAHRRGLKVYESLKSLNEVIGTQYGDRVLFELIQNAHDAHAADEQGEIAIRLLIDDDARGELLVANRGRPFTASNLEAIRNIGTSDKEVGEGIGNKGLGFRSVEALTDDVRIYSASSGDSGRKFDGYCFRFATLEEIAAGLARLGAADDISNKVAENIPRYLVPMPAPRQSEQVQRLAQEGFATVVALPLTSGEAIELAREQVLALLDTSAPVLLFLDRIAALDVEVISADGVQTHRRLTRAVHPVGTAALQPGMRIERAVLNDGANYLLVRRNLPKADVVEAVRESLPVAPPLKRWLKWKGDAVVSVAVGLGAAPVAGPRLFNFLPMDESATSPIAGHIDAPFFADIDRRSIKPDLPLNRHLLEAAAVTAATAALAIVEGELPIPEAAVVDLACWTGPHLPKIVEAFASIGRPLTDAAIWPVVSGGNLKWAAFDRLYAWPGATTQQLTPARLASVADVAIVPTALGETRISRIGQLAAAVSLPLTPGSEALCSWTEAVAKYLTERPRKSARRWQEFFDDIVAIYAAASVGLSGLKGKKFLIGSEGKLLAATAEGIDGAPPVFYRAQSRRGRREGPPSPPASLSRKFRFLQDGVELSAGTLGAFEKAGLLRRYDPVEALGGLKGALGASATETQRREALLWSFKVWRTSGGKAVEDTLRAAGLYVPTLGGWHSAREALLSASWSARGRILEQYLVEAAPLSVDCAAQRDRLLPSFADWPRAALDDRRDDWLRFLELIGVREGLQPVAGVIKRSGTPTGFWNNLLLLGDSSLGLDEAWTLIARTKSLSYPYTEYRLEGEVWRLPGQLEHASLPPSAKECLSELVVAYASERGAAGFTFVVAHWRGSQRVELPTPLQMFLRHGEWAASFRGDEMVFAAPANSWSTTVQRQIPPRFVPRFSAEPGSRAPLPPILFDPRIGLRDWAAPESAPDRLSSLAVALVDLSAAERRDLRDQLRRAWGDIASQQLELPDTLPLVVERSGVLEVCRPDPDNRPIIHITSERQGFAARALADRGEAVLDVGESSATKIRDLLEATGAFSPRLADAGDVRLIVDGEEFEARNSDPLLVSGRLAWLVDAAVLAHEHIGDPLEARNLPGDEIERRLRAIRLRRCDTFALLIGDEHVQARQEDQIQAVPDPRIPTLLVAGTEDLDLGGLTDAATALTKLMRLRHNSLEQMLGRLAREGFAGESSGPTEEAYARALRCEIAVVRDYFAATRGGLDRRVRALIPVIDHLAGDGAAAQLAERHERLGPAFRLGEWLREELGTDVADRCLAAVEETEDQAVIRRLMGFDFAAYGATLAKLGYPPLNNEADFERLFAVFINELRPSLVDRVRRRYFETWRQEGDLAPYVAHRQLDFVRFDPTWVAEREAIDREFIATHAAGAADAVLGPDNLSVKLPDFESVTTSNRKLITSHFARLAGVVRAWCRKNNQSRLALLATDDPQPLVRAVDGTGLIDFEALKPQALPHLCHSVGAWPAGMPTSDDLAVLGLTEDDLKHEEREAREEKRRIEIKLRTVDFAGQPLDTGADNFAHLFENLAETALADDDEWYARSRAPRLEAQDQNDPARRRRGKGGGQSESWKNQPPEAMRKAMGIASEWLAREYLKRRHPREMSDECWVSSNRSAFCSGSPGDDGLGYDFRVLTARHEYLYEVKSALDAGGEFELTARELEVAGSASLERKRRYRVLYVPYVFDPSQWRVLPLMNPAAAATRNRFRLVRSGSARYRFEMR